MYVLGIDQSFTCTGLVILDYDSKDISHFSTIKTVNKNKHKTFSIEERIIIITDKIETLIKENEIEVVFLEGLSLDSKSRSSLDLAGLFFSIVTFLKRNHIHYFFIPPTTVKKHFVHGRAKKEELFAVMDPEHAFLLTDSGLKKGNGLFDVSDAYFICRCGIEKNLIKDI